MTTKSALFWVTVLCTVASVSANLLPNPSFEGGTAATAGDWTSRAWTGKDVARFEIANPGRSGKRCLTIASVKGADAAWTAHVTVEPQTRYELSGWIKTQSISGAKGALFNIQGVVDSATEAITGTTDWTRVSVVFNSGDKSSLEFNCLFGGWGKSTGQVWYDDVMLRKIDVIRPLASVGGTLPGTLGGKRGLRAIPIMKRDSMPFPILGVGVDYEGTVYLTQTARQMREEISLIQSPFLLEDCMALTSTAAKSKWIRKNYSKVIAGRQRVRDFNGDGKVDVADLEVHSEKIFIVKDSDNDGVYDESNLFADGFNDLLTGVAHSVAPIDGHVYASVIPDVWKLTDSDGDGVADKRDSIAHGFAPHIGYGNHDLHSVIQGYDGKLYWSMGDRGLHVETQEGRKVSNPHSGAILRSNLDGSDLELFAYGLRNCQYIDFDDFGNLFSVDHDADFQGERERLVYLAEGSDSGWRMHYQYRTKSLVKAARDDLYNPWLDEALWTPFHQGQPSHVLPPIENSWNAPASFSYQPGTALGGEYRSHFLLGVNGAIRAFRMVPDGAGFKREGDEIVVSGLGQQVLTSTFAPDGRLLFTLWKPNANRSALWALTGERTGAGSEVKQLLAEGFGSHSALRLEKLLGHADRRVRQQAQFELVRRKEAKLLERVVRDVDHTLLSRLHALWGLGQLRYCNADLIDVLAGDKESEMRAQVARWAGDLGHDPRNRISSLLSDQSPRVRAMAAIATGKLKEGIAFQSLCEMIASADNKVPVLRHAGVVGLAGAATMEDLANLSQHPSEALRIAAVLALRRQGASAELVGFLADVSPRVVEDAVLAIYDEANVDTSAESFHVVARLLDPARSLAVNVRALAASRRLGTRAEAKRIADFAVDPGTTERARIEALYALESWTESAKLDPVDGRHFPVAAGKTEDLQSVIGPGIWRLAESDNSKVSACAVSLLERTKPTATELERMASGVLDVQQGATRRIQWLQFLRLQAAKQFESSAIRLLSDGDEAVRVAAARELLAANLAKEKVWDYLRGVLKQASSPTELQQAIGMIEVLPDGTKILNRLVDQLITGKIAPEIQLDVIERAKAVGVDENELAAKIKEYLARTAKSKPVIRFGSSLHGGDAAAGKKIFHSHPQAQCSKCHAIKLSDKQVGPSLEGIGEKHSRSHLLESIVDPQAAIALGYGIVTVTLKDGTVVGGTLVAETDMSLTVKLPNGESRTLDHQDVGSSTNPIGMMPDLTALLSPRQIRDLVAYLSTL